MSDDIDKAQAANEVNTQDALERQRMIARNMPRLAARGECLNPHCAEPFYSGAETRLFCGPQCEAEHRRLRRA